MHRAGDDVILEAGLKAGRVQAGLDGWPGGRGEEVIGHVDLYETITLLPLSPKIMSSYFVCRN